MELETWLVVLVLFGLEEGILKTLWFAGNSLGLGRDKERKEFL